MAIPRQPIAITLDLVERLDRAVAERVVSSVAAHALLDPDGGAEVVTLPGGIRAPFDGPTSPIGRVVGVGFDRPATAEDVDAIVDFYHSRGRPARVDLCPYADPSWVARLGERGFTVAGFVQVLARGLDDLDGHVAANPATRARTDEDYQGFSYAVMHGFAEGRPLLPFHIADRARHQDRTEVWIIRQGGEVVAGGLLTIWRGVGQLFGAATLPTFRGNGAQTALIAARLASAKRQGATLATVQASPGSRSERNVLRAGFLPVYTQVFFTLNVP